MTIAVLLTCHNRRELTLNCLSQLALCSLPEGFDIRVTLVDDGSDDGTGEQVEARFPFVEVIRGDGNLFWCGGMRKAWRHAAGADPDHYLLLNDDTLLEPDALKALLEIVGSPEIRVIAVAAIRDPRTGEATYGGIRRKSGLVAASGKNECCDTFNANAVLLTRAVYRELGVFHEAYDHAMGDFDYGYSATRKGIRVIQSAEYLGVCRQNPMAGTWRDTSLPRATRWKKLQSPKGLPFMQWLIYSKRNAGWIWPLRAVSPALRILLGK